MTGSTLLSAVAVLVTSLAPAAPTPDTLPDLRAVLDTGIVLRDTNADSVIDALTVRIVLPDDADEADVAAAAEVAARLAYETSATDLGLVVDAGDVGTPSEPVVAIGADNPFLGRAGLDAGAARRGLAPGEGALLRLPAGPGAPRGGVAVVGYDATGLLAAAGYLAGRYPAVWAPDGGTWRDAMEKVERFTTAVGSTPSEDPGAAAARPSSGAPAADEPLRLERIVVNAAAPGVSRAEVRVRTTTAAGFDELVRTLNGEGTPGPEEDATPDPEAEAADSAAGGSGEADEPTLSDLHVRDLHRLDVRVEGPDGRVRTVPVRPDEPWETPEGRAYTGRADRAFGLPDLYTIDGLYRDTNRDLVPDRTVGWISLDGAEAPEGTADLATRIGLETAGIRLPLVGVTGQADDLSERGFPIVVGTGHYQVGRLRDEGKLRGAAAEAAPGGASDGLGFVQLVDRAFGDAPAMVVGGGDAAGLQAALDWTAGRAPYLWRYGKGEYRLADAATAIRRFFQAREAPGQLALGLAKLETWLERDAASDTGPPARIEVELSALEVPDGLADLLAARAAVHAPEAEITAATWSTGFGVGDTIVDERWQIPWEVDDVRALLAEDVYPHLRPGPATRVEVRVSEPPEVRAELTAEIRDSLEARGIRNATVHVLNAYKQGYSWIEDVVLPRLRGGPVAEIDLRYHTLEESDEIRWQTVAAETRWLQELYPVDAVLSRELGIPDSAVTFHPTREREPVYVVEARDSAGTVILRDRFTPKYVVRPFFDLFPEYEKVRVTTGWVTAALGADTLVDERVVTDPERFWDRLQTETYADVVEYVMDTQDGRPSPANAPYFDEFTVELRLSEPNHRIGVDEEVISSLEALHEDIYFETLTLFDLIGNRYDTSLPYPGRVLPRMDPEGAGLPGEARVTLTGKERGATELLVRTFESDDDPDPRVRRYGLSSLPAPAPVVTGVAVGAGAEGLSQLLVRLEAADSVDRYADFAERSSEAAIDRQFMSVELLSDMVEALGRLHDAGMVEEALAWDRVGELAVDFRVEDDSTFSRVVTLPRSSAPTSTDNPRLLAEGWSYEDEVEPGGSMVQWQTPIPPAENDSILARLNTFPGIDVYYLTESFLGQPVWAVDILLPSGGRYVSQAKLNALKPTLFISGRQHANEVSSTSHMLRLAELLATEDSVRSWLRHVNVVLHPVANPDGARLAVQMQEVNPDFMLHAGYLGSLGVDMTAGERSDDPMYPESQARRRIRETWLPDVYINMHGYPSHEWVQYFAGYSAWVRSRRGGARSWWAPRGWFIPGMSWVDDEENPEYRTAQFALLDSIAHSITSRPEVEAMNRRLYKRYKKYGEQDRDDFREYFHEGILVNLALEGTESIGTGLYSPRITWFSTTTEAPDETARGDWLELVATAGLAHSTALVRYLGRGTYDIEREVEAYDGAVERSVYRLKPVLPAGSTGNDEEGGDEGAEAEGTGREPGGGTARDEARDRAGARR